MRDLWSLPSLPNSPVNRQYQADQALLAILEQAGLIRRIPGQARGIRLCPPPVESAEDVDIPAPVRNDSLERDALRLPVFGRVAAGLPIGADIGSDQVVLLDRNFFSPAPDYLLKVKGDSMRDDGIFDGDLIGVHRTADAHSGQIVVARIDEEITVKLLKISKGQVRLLPRNPDYSPIEVQPGQDFAIEGLYCGLVRPNR